MMRTSKPSIVIFGAGNIGRGFIGQLFYQANYDVILVDAAAGLVRALNEAGQYPVQLVSAERNEELMVSPVRALLVSNQQAVNEAVCNADILATAVGVNILPHIARPLARAIHNRYLSGNPKPLDILVCENKLDAGQYLKDLIIASDPALKDLIDQQVGFVETSIGRMVPVLSAQERQQNPLLIRTEPYQELPVDAAGFKGPIPALPSLKAFTPFHFYHKRKLFIHNMGHALTAYLGWLVSCRTIAEAIVKTEIRFVVESAMRQAGQALSVAYNVPPAEIEEHIQDLLRRFANRQLGDTVERVGRDPLRKLAFEDRLIGPLVFALEYGIDPFYIALGVSAALRFLPDEDPGATELTGMIRQHGIDHVLQLHCRLAGSQTLDHWRGMIVAQHAMLGVII